MSFLTVSLVALAYVGLLFWLARWGESLGRDTQRLQRIRPWAYSLALGVFCTSWTYYGAVGSAATQGWSYLPILLGPALLWLFGLPLITRLVRAGKKQNISSVADFMASRYGKRQRVAVLVTVLAVLATIPYIALQLKAVTLSFTVLTGQSADTPVFFQEQASFIVALLMAFFALLFGTRKTDVTGYQSGVIIAVAFESLVKLVALVVAALLALSWFDGLPDFVQAMRSNPHLSGSFHREQVSLNFVTQMLLATVAALCLPRQFFIGVVQNGSLSDLKKARWVFPAYLSAIALLILPISGASILAFQGQSLNPDTYVLQLPMQQGADWVALLVFLGGFSASTAMIIVSTITLSTMISNDVVLPMLIQRRYRREVGHQDFSGVLLTIRRLSVVFVVLAALFYHLSFSGFAALTSIGLLSFALIVQLAPAFVGGLYWKGGQASGAVWGLVAGVGLWAYTLMLPTLVDAGMLSSRFLIEGPFGLSWLRPEALLGLEGLDRLSHGVFISLAFNTLVYVLVSLKTAPRLLDRIQASAYVSPAHESFPMASGVYKSAPIRTGDLRTMLEQFLGRARTYQLLQGFSEQEHVPVDEEAVPDFELISYCERVLAGVIGTASARAMMNSLLEGRAFGLEDVVTFFDETAQALQQNQSILYASLENIEQGISVLDKDLKLVAWNSPYARLFNYPDGFLQVGTSVESMIRYNAQRGLCGPGSPDSHVAKRLDHMRRGTPHCFQRWRPDGSVVEMRGNPLPGGGFVTTFTDITEHTQDKKALEEAKKTLERRVQERTETISQMNVELLREIDQRRAIEQEVQLAREQAEEANAAKTRFLALASHDILQPLNAARLYVSALQENPDSDDRRTVIGNLNESLGSTEALLATLLEIARLDDGAIVPQPETFDLSEVLQPLVNEFRTLAQARGIRVRAVISQAKVVTDRLYLRRIVQNLLSNAVKYAGNGEVLLGCRRRPGGIMIQVWDTGEGIPPSQQERIFQDFYRLKQHQHQVSGAGLGLGVVDRLSKLLKLRVCLNSALGRYTCFSLCVPLAHASGKETASSPALDLPAANANEHRELAGLRILCVDDESANLDALLRLLGKWQCRMHSASSVAEALNWAEHSSAPDILLMDFHLQDELDGLELIEALRERWSKEIPAAILTASHEAEVIQRIRDKAIPILHKPIKPAALKALLRHFNQSSGRG